jgi:hypothetical protein
MAQNGGIYVSAVAIVFLVLSWTAVVLRVYARTIITNLGKEDSLAIVTLVCT